MIIKEISEYRATALRRMEYDQQELAQREKDAWETARRAAALLKEQFGAKRVVVYGSLVHKGCFTLWSDIDIAAWGISPSDTFRAMSAVMGIGRQIEVNLVDVEICRPSLLLVIERDGVDL
ncbi:MAG: nucleotidyltransferase domain-containing protein [Nitrospira sp.]|nr:nucleotidyltransferase domain-containing protein [Nitrospira sp.]